MSITLGRTNSVARAQVLDEDNYVRVSIRELPPADVSTDNDRPEEEVLIYITDGRVFVEGDFGDGISEREVYKGEYLIIPPGERFTMSTLNGASALTVHKKVTTL